MGVQSSCEDKTSDPWGGIKPRLAHQAEDDLYILALKQVVGCTLKGHCTEPCGWPTLFDAVGSEPITEGLVVAPVHTGCVTGIKSCRLRGLIIPKNLVFTFRGLCTRGPAGVWDSLIHWIYPTSGLMIGQNTQDLLLISYGRNCLKSVFKGILALFFHCSLRGH